MFDRIMGIIGAVMHAMASICLILMFVLINVEVIGRYLFNTSTLISDEYSGYFFTWLVMLGLLADARSGSTLRVEFGLDMMSPSSKEIAQLVGSVASLCVVLVLTYACYVVTAQSYRYGTVALSISETPIWIPQSVMVVGLALLIVHYAQDVIRRTARLLA